MKINIIDPGLHSQTGHHFDWCYRIAKYLHSLGYKNIEIYVNRKTSVDAKSVLEKYGQVIPIFSENPYLPGRSVDPLCGDLTLYFDRSVILARTLQSIDQNAFWIWPTLFDYQLNALALAKIKCGVSTCIHTLSEHRSPLANLTWRDAAIRAHKAKINIHFGVTFNELSAVFQPLLNQNVSTMPLLVDAHPAQAPKSKLQRIGFFGNQSTYKGLPLIPELTKQIMDLGYEITIQDSKGKISGNESSRLKILSYVEDIAEEIEKCDLVMLPYNPYVYKHKASAIAWEALARGVPVIAPQDTVPGDFIAQHNAGITFKSFTVDSIIEALVDANLKFSDIANGAFNASKNWAQHHGTDKFTNAMLLSMTNNE